MRKKIKWILYFMFWILILLFTLNVTSMNSSNYRIDSSVISGGGSNITSTNYRIGFTLGDIIGNISSGLYKQFFGFWYSSTVGVSGTLDVNITYPLNNSGFTQYTTNLTINATVKCVGGQCGLVYALARYNKSSATPDTAINTTSGALPFYITGLEDVTTQTVESTNDIGKYSSIALDSNGKAHISNYDATGANLQYCNNTASDETWSCVAVDTANDVGQYSSIAIDSNNKIHISHYDNTNFDLRYCNNTAGSWSCTTVDTTDDSGAYSSIAIDSNNKVHISYYNYNNIDTFSLKYCNNTASDGSWSCTAIESGNVGYFSSIALDSNNKVHISHRDALSGILRYCNNTAGSWSCTAVESGDVGVTSSIAIDSNNKVHISHYNINAGYLDLRYCNNTAGTWSCTAIETANNVGYYSSIALDSNNKVHISHFDDTNDDLRYCNNIKGNWSCSKLADADANFLGYPNGRALAIKKGRIVDSTSFSNKAHISWYNNTDLMYTDVVYTINPQISSQTLENGESWNVTWTLNVTSSSTEIYLIDVFFNSSYGNSIVPDNDTEDRRVNLNPVVPNTAPTIQLLSPSHGNSTTDRTPTFVYNGTDAEGDSLVYNINITCVGGCSADNRFETNYSGGENYTPSTDFAYLYDNGYYYNWSVQACENETAELLCSNWPVAWTINISSLINITLTNNFINFGVMNLRDSKNTTDVSIDPFAFRNDGNALTNISMNATQLWTSVSQPSEYFRSKVRGYIGNASWANTTWFNLPPITGLEPLVDKLNYTDGVDSVEIDILLTVPGAEGPENKTSTVNFQSSLGE